ncbi:MAG: 2-amino-4-hydroxy-6-hydroxymethyldihydropteridine diphosphokinase [Thermoleophilia bacterium]
MAKAFLSLGCNIGDCGAILSRAVGLLAELPLVAVTRVSSVYMTEPVGMKEQPDFFNIAVELETGLEPLELLKSCRRIEEELGGRNGRVAQGPRSADLDILLYGDEALAHRDLQLPHPRMTERAFVLVPLAEIAPDHRLPDGRSVSQALADLSDPHRVRKNGKLDHTAGG